VDAAGADGLARACGRPETADAARSGLPRHYGAMTAAICQAVTDRLALDRLAASDFPLNAAECAARARDVAGLVDLSALDRGGGPGEAQLLWRNQTSEAWLNLWWDARDTGYHDHDGSCVGVYVIEGRAYNEALAINQPVVLNEYRPGESFSFEGDGIHRMEHDAGAVTIHVYSPPIRSIGHYELVDDELRRRPGGPDDPTPPSPNLARARHAGSHAGSVAPGR
jgi:hypothetical protein